MRTTITLICTLAFLCGSAFAADSPAKPKASARAKATAKAAAPAQPKPTVGKVAYGTHERQVLDFWKSQSAQPTPVSFYIHGDLEQGRWYQLVIEIAGDAMRVILDDKPLGVLRSPGLNHPRKGTFHFTVTGKDALFDDVRIWAAQGETAKQP